MKRKQLQWMKDVRIGDVLENRFGTQRVVRNLKRYKDGELRSVSFAIKRCSWTGRCYTVYGYTDLRMQDYRLVARTRMGSEMDWKIYKEMKSHSARVLSCCDVQGVA